MRLLIAVGLGAVLIAAPRAQGQAQAPAPVKGATTGFMHAIHATNNVETTLSFYRDVFGLNTKVQPFANPAVPILTNSPGVSLRVAMLRIPGRGFNFELTEFTNTDRRPAQPKITDPGAPHMKFLVKDIDAVVAAAKQRGAPFITTGGTPVRSGGAGAVFMRDPDGYIVAALQEGEYGGRHARQRCRLRDGAHRGRHGSVSEILARHARLGVHEPIAVHDGCGLRGADGASERRPGPLRERHCAGSTARIEMSEFRGVTGTPFDLRVPDPGASGMAIRVAAIQDLLPKLKAAGVRVVSKDGALVEWDAKTRNVFVKDPNGLLIELVGTVAPPAVAR